MVFLEVGPGVVRPFARDGGPPAATEQAALAGVDDPVVLLDGKPVATAELWRTLLGSVAGPVTVVHPSWWPPARVERIAGMSAGGVVAVSRAEAIREHRDRHAVVVEIGADVIAVSAGRTLRLFGREYIATAVAAVAGAARAGGVVVDAPRGVPGADHAAAEICAALHDDGVPAARADLGEMLAAGRRRPAGRRRRRWPVPAGVVLLAGVAVALLPAPQTEPGRTEPQTEPRPAPNQTWASLVEGRIAVRIPPDWTVGRVTSGPGSRRVQVSSADGAVVHITQAHVPGTTLADAAEVLGRAVATQPAGVFTEFRADDRVGERAAVTYRETRPGRTVRWTVILDGATRISIGCQDPPAPAESVGPVCAEAVASARELTGSAGAF